MAQRAGRLRRSVIIQSVTETQNTFGEQTEAWAEDATVHAQIEPGGGSESIRHDQVTPDITHVVTIRYKKGVTPERRLLIPRDKTALNGAINDAVTSITVDADLGISGSTPFRIKVDSEIMIVTAGHGTTTWTVTRGADGTSAASHSDDADVRHYAVLDISSVQNMDERDRYMVLSCREVV